MTPETRAVLAELLATTSEKGAGKKLKKGAIDFGPSVLERAKLRHGFNVAVKAIPALSPRAAVEKGYAFYRDRCGGKASFADFCRFAAKQ